MRKLLYHDNPVFRMLASLPVVDYEYISLCLQYAIKDHHCVQESTLGLEFVWNAFCNHVF